MLLFMALLFEFVFIILMNVIMFVFSNMRMKQINRRLIDEYLLYYCNASGFSICFSWLVYFIFIDVSAALWFYLVMYKNIMSTNKILFIVGACVLTILIVFFTYKIIIRTFSEFVITNKKFIITISNFGFPRKLNIDFSEVKFLEENSYNYTTKIHTVYNKLYKVPIPFCAIKRFQELQKFIIQK